MLRYLLLVFEHTHAHVEVVCAFANGAMRFIRIKIAFTCMYVHTPHTALLHTSTLT